MRRRQLVALGSIGVLVLLVGVSTAMASPGSSVRESPAGATATPTATARPASDWHIDGAIQAMNGEFWTVQGFVFRVTNSTRIDSSTPLVIGAQIHASGVVQSDGTWLATHVWTDRSGQSATPTATVPATSTATATAISTATATATSTSTAAPTDTATPTSTPTVTSERTATDGDEQESDTGDGDRASAVPIVVQPGHGKNHRPKHAPNDPGNHPGKGDHDQGNHGS